MLVRSPMLTNSESSVIVERLEPGEPHRRLAIGGLARRCRAVDDVGDRGRCASGVVPQQPPTRLTSPAPANSSSTAAIWSGVSSYSPNAFGSPALG